MQVFGLQMLRFAGQEPEAMFVLILPRAGVNLQWKIGQRLGMGRAMIQRRDFLRKTVKAGLGAGLGSVFRWEPVEAGPSRRGVVVKAQDARLRRGRSLDTDRLGDLLDAAMQQLFDVDSADEAWKKVVRPGEVIGLKVNCIAGKGNATTLELVELVAERLQRAGIRAKDIIIWDRLNRDLENAGYRIRYRGNRVRCFGNDAAGYDNRLFTYGSAGSLVTRVLTEMCDGFINLPVLKDHGIVGVTLALKNLFGAIHNPNKYHINVGDPYVADVFMFPPIRKKHRLTICDGTIGQYEGGPSYIRRWFWYPNMLLVATDPVALDRIGWDLIEEKRKQEKLPSLKEDEREPRYIFTAADRNHRLGIADIERIRVLNVKM